MIVPRVLGVFAAQLAVVTTGDVPNDPFVGIFILLSDCLMRVWPLDSFCPSCRKEFIEIGEFVSCKLSCREDFDIEFVEA
jgi:hypothetical protein